MNNQYRMRPGLPLLFSAFVMLVFLFTAGSAFCESDKKFLWEVRSSKNTVYLLGSIHLLDKDSYPLPSQFEKAYRESETIVLEADIGGTQSAKAQELMLRLGVIPDGRSIRELISADTYVLLEKKLSASGLNAAAVERMKPWLCAMTLGVMEVQRLGFEPQFGIDRHFFGRAKKDGKKIVGLETIDAQIHLFADMSPALQESLLQQTLEEMDLVEKMLREIVQAWQQGNTEKLSEITMKSFKTHPEIYRELFLQRNLRWAGSIEKLLNQDEKAMVIVGAGHLAGKDSLVSLLTQKGFRVTQK